MSTAADPADVELRVLRRRLGVAVALIERALHEHSRSRQGWPRPASADAPHPLVDVLLDLHNTLCGERSP